MGKQTFPIPEGCKAITMEIIDNTIVTTFEPAQAQPKFKRGDVIYCDDNDGFSWVFILKGITDGLIYPYSSFCSITSTGEIATNDRFRHSERILRHATPEEAHRLWDALAKEGKRWNPETMQVEEIKKEIPRAKLGDVYWSFDILYFHAFKAEESNNSTDNKRYEQGRYFSFKEQAQRAADKLKAALADFWKEELK